MFGHMKFASRFTKPGRHQNRNDIGPGDFRMRAGQSFSEEPIQTEPLQQLKRQPHIAKPASSFGLYPPDIDLDSFRDAGIEQ
jgi:hypothetical protein